MYSFFEDNKLVHQIAAKVVLFMSLSKQPKTSDGFCWLDRCTCEHQFVAAYITYYVLSYSCNLYVQIYKFDIYFCK